MNATTTEKRKTIREFYADLRELAEVNDRIDLVEFIDGRIVQLDKKNKPTGERKMTATQVANEGYKTEILEFLVAHPNGKFKVADLRKAVPICVELDLSSSKVTALLRQLKEVGKVSNETEKGSLVWFVV